mgnify:CR=1 FL=1
MGIALLAARGVETGACLLGWEEFLDMLSPEAKRRPLTPVERGVKGGGGAAVCAITPSQRRKQSKQAQI